MRAARSIAGRRLLRLLRLALAALVAVLAPASSFPCDSTCCLMLTRGTSGLVGRGGFQIDLSYRYTDMSARFASSTPTDLVIRPKVLLETGQIIPGYHEDREGTESFLQLDAAWGVASATTVFASLPVLTHKSYVIGHGGTQTTYNVRGVGDLVVGARQALVRGPGRMLVASLGVQLPLGKSGVLDEYDSTILDPTLQPGTGSGDVITALQWSTLGPGRTEVALSGTYQINTANGHDYRFANQAIAALTVGRPLGQFTPSLQVKLFSQGRSQLRGSDVPSTGATIVYLNAGLRYRSAEGVGLYGYALVPGYRHVNDAQLAPRFSLLFGISKAF
jgi:hypothetical protein